MIIKFNWGSIVEKTVLKIHALENALGVPTQDTIIDQPIERVLNSLSADEKRSYKLWLEMFEKRELT